MLGISVFRAMSAAQISASLGGIASLSICLPGLGSEDNGVGTLAFRIANENDHGESI